jgi:hypothetical protein
MSSDKREDWIECLLSKSGVAAAETPEIPLKQSESTEEDFTFHSR